LNRELQAALLHGRGVESCGFTYEELLWFLEQRYGKPLNIEFGPGRQEHRPPWPSIGLNPSADPVADIWHDLDGPAADKVSIPLPSNSVQSIKSNQFLEHISQIIPHMNECWRVLVSGGKMEVCVPHRDSPWAVADPTHKRLFVPESFNYFCIGADGNPFVDSFSDYGIRCAFIMEKCVTHPYIDISVVLRKP